MTNFKLNNLVYFAQAWSLKKLGKPLFDEVVQAWKHGPAIPSVYYVFEKCGLDKMSKISSECDELSSEELNLLLDVAHKYCNHSDDELKNSHTDQEEHGLKFMMRLKLTVFQEN